MNEILEELKVLPEVEAVLLPDVPDSGPDQEPWSLDVYGTPAPEVRRALLSARSTLTDVGLQDGTLDTGELNDGTRYRLEYRSLDDTAARVAAVAERHEAAEGFTTDEWRRLLGTVLFDRGRLAAVQKRFDTAFPAPLTAAIVARNWPLLRSASGSRQGEVARSLKNGSLAAPFHVAAYLAGAFDLVFAANGEKTPGPNMVAARSAALPALPFGWSALLAAVDKAPRSGLVDALDKLSSALEVFLTARGLLAPVEKKVRPAAAATAAPPPPAPTSPLTVYTDGGCIGNPGKGAWAYLVDDGVLRVEDTAGDPMTTNNKMELQAVISALSAIAARQEWKGRAIRVHTDSQYVRNGITTWIKTWSGNGWKTAAKEPVKNQDLWMELQKWDQALKPEWKWVKGHAGNPNNERCDALVRRTMDQM